jgi:hypothetical protein
LELDRRLSAACRAWKLFYIYDDAPRVVVGDPAIAAGPIDVRLRALLA